MSKQQLWEHIDFIEYVLGITYNGDIYNREDMEDFLAEHLEKALDIAGECRCCVEDLY